eukprot:symbB.v1.2.035778.t1/scaffold4900.1/size33223/1
MVWSFCLLITLNLCEGKPLPKLATFAVEGHLSDGRTESVPFDPPFPTANRFDYKCYLDNIMNSFALKVDPEKFAILSRLLEDGKEVTTRSQLHHISIDEGAEKIFAVSLSSTHSQNVSKYTLQVLHRLGFSTSLEDLSFMTGHLKEAFHVQSEIQAYHAVQDVKEDFAEIQCVKEDGGQEITCAIEDAETRGDGRPSKAELTLFPHQYSPSLEKMHSLETWSRSTDRRARIQNCRIPIDTWRKVTVGLNITSADKTRHRHLQIIIDRDGCQNQSFFHDGRCILHCPIFHYEQRFNWRCGDCGSNCEFCAHFARCKRCRLDVPLKKYELQDGICEVVRVHPNKIYFFAAWYLGSACAVLCGLYLSYGLWFLISKDEKAQPNEEGNEDERLPLTIRGNPNRPSQVARERAGLTSARDYASAFAGRDEHGVLIRSASARPSEPSGPPPLRPSEPSGPPPVRQVLKPKPKTKKRSRSPLRRSDPEPKTGPTRERLIDLPRPAEVKHQRVAQEVDIVPESEPVVNPGGAASGSRAIKPVITPAKVKAEPRTPKKASGISSKATAVQKYKGEVAEAEAAEAEAKKKADKEARLEAKRKAEEEEQKKKRKDTNERPLIALDWHNTLSFDGIEGHGVAERSAEILRDLQQRGYDFCVISFASSPDTQRAVQQKALQFECELIRPFTSIDIVNRKFRSDPQKRPSICGLITSKAEQVSLPGACAFVDDQSKLLQDVEDLQSRRAEKHRCKCLKSEPYARSSLFKLAAFLHHKQPEEFPLPRWRLQQRPDNSALVRDMAEARLQRLAQDRDLLTQQAEQAEQHAARLRDELQILKRQGGCPSSLPSNWLNVGETDEHVYKIKHLKGVHITKLPTDATSCREWRAAFLAAVSRIDLTSRDVLVKFSVYCMDSGRGRRFREMLQASNDFVMFNKHVAAELIKPEVLSANSDLAHELTSWVEACASRQEGPKGMALMNIIIGYYETGTDHSVALNQMHLLGLNLEGKTQKDLTEFVKKANYILHGLKPADRPAEATMYSWLWHQVKRVPMLSRMVDKVKSSARNSRKRSFEWIWTQIAEEIRERRHDSNYENVSKGLKSAPSNQLALAAPKTEPPSNRGKGSKSNLSTPAATSTVTITEVEGRKVMSAWEGFCTFCRKALPSLDMFLKLSIPILPTVVSSVVNSIDKIGEASAAAMLKEPIKDFRTFSLEFLGDTGAAYDIGSLRALEEQGIDLKTIEPWIKVLDHPINFSTGGGQQMATEAIRMYCENLGELHMHLLSSLEKLACLGEIGMPVTRSDAGAGLFQPAMTAIAEEKQFCGFCLEGIPACVCSTYDAPKDDSSKVVHPSGSIGEDEQLQSMAGRQHLKRKEAKEHRKELWEKKRKNATRGAHSDFTTDLIRGDEASRKLVKDIHDFYAEKGQEVKNEERQVYQNIADYINQEDDQQVEPAEIAQYEPHHEGLPGHGTMIEFCASDDSMMGRVAEEVGVHIVRPWTLWQNMNLHLHGEAFAAKLEEDRRRSRLMVRKFRKLARATARKGGRVTFEWPRHCAGWALKEIQELIKELGMVVVDFDGCRVGLCNDKGEPHLKQWRLITTDNRIARIFSGLRCLHGKNFKHAVIEGSSTRQTGFYPREMCEYIMRALYPDIVVKNVPAMPVVAFEESEQQHRENEPEKNTYAMPMVIEYVDTLASAAMQADSDADDEAELRESREARLAREARSLDHMMLHHRKNPMCEHCQRGRMLKRYFHRVRDEPEEGELPYVRPTKFGDVVEADHVFPSVESQGLSGEQAALLVRDRFSGVSFVYPQTERSVDSNYQALKHFGGYMLSGNTGVVFHSDNAQELTKAADMMCWVPDPSGPNAWPHNSHVEREVRTVKELCRPSLVEMAWRRRQQGQGFSSGGICHRGYVTVDLMVIDYDAIRGRNHLYWGCEECLLNMDDEEHELRKKEYDRSITEGVLPYDVNIDAYPVEDKPTPERHAYITWARLLQHGFTENCPGCTHGHHRHSRACRARFDALFPRRRSGDGQEVEPEVESGQLAIEDADDCSYAPTTPSVSGETE